MRTLSSRLWSTRLLAWAIAGAFCAAILILVLQHRALTALDEQTAVILRQVSEQTAKDIAASARAMLEGPVFDTLTRVNHPELRAGRLDLVAQRYAEGLRTYPHVERFIVWSRDTERRVPGEALFSARTTPVASRDGLPFSRDPALGAAVLALAREHESEQRIYVIGVPDGVSPTRHVLLRLFWTDATRLEYFAILGFVVDPATFGPRLFTEVESRRADALLRARNGTPDLHLHVIDAAGRTVYGRALAERPIAAARMPFPAMFYPPERIDSRLAGTVPAATWHIDVSAPRVGNVLGMDQRYWPTLLSVGLMLIALALTVQANRRAEDLAHMQADFISHVSHQLKTPLSLLSAVTETVTMDRVRSPEKLAQYLGIIRGEVSRLSVLVKRILEFSRLEQPRRYELEHLDLAALVDETVAAFETSLATLHFHFTVEHDGTEVPVHADPAAIEQALINLLDNAVKYSGDARDITVRVSTRDDAAVVDVIDRGIGIADGDRRRVFEKFYRGSGSAHRIDGFGLGLPIAQQLIHAHHGRLEFTSEPGHGSTFRLVLPLAPRRADPVTSPLRDVEVAR